MARKAKTCRICREPYMPISSLAKVCSPKCALEHVVIENAKRDRVETRRRREKLKTKGDYTREAQVEFNKFIRARDNQLPCISCGRDTGAKRNAGHYKPVGSHPELRFNELNCHGQCEHCNTYKSGNLTAYRIALIDKIGAELVEWLEGPHDALQATIDDLKWLKKYYKQRAKDLLTRDNHG